MTRTYVQVWLLLMGLVALTVISAYVPMGSLNWPVNTLISAAKAWLVMRYFMRLAQAPVVARLYAVVGFAWIVILLALSLADALSRA